MNEYEQAYNGTHPDFNMPSHAMGNVMNRILLDYTKGSDDIMGVGVRIIILIFLILMKVIDGVQAKDMVHMKAS